ncbi:hypothetical protein MYX06_00005, partial [Patescibacteria group bacterium AH-259-L05]|nr:hypothetical protein [Patescibacteria group bacterium AH-259-L05]
NMPQSEEKACQNCKTSFVIDASDFNFYQKIKVPPPTWCPECRLIRRMVFRNERTLYERQCDLCKQNVITMYSARTPFPLYCRTCWFSDKWDPMRYEREYDFTKPFFEQFKELLLHVPKVNLEGTKNINCQFSNFTWESKNCYLSPTTLFSENIYYSRAVDKSMYCMDCMEVVRSQWCYESINSRDCYNSWHLFNCRSCIDSKFLFDCVNCQNCFLSSNLRNKSFVFRNKQYSQEEYVKKVQEFEVENSKNLEKARGEYRKIIQGALHKYAQIIKSVNASGDYLTNVKNVKQCFSMFNLEDVRYSFRGYNVKDSADLFGTDDCQWDYESVNDGLFSSHTKFSSHTHTNCLDIQYADYCRSSSYLFGCAGLRKKQYCILNKQYTREEYETLVPRIIDHMNKMPYVDAKGRVYTYGEFFPLELSPFAYNETVAQEYFPLTKEQALDQGYAWKDSEQRDYKITIKPEELPDYISDVKDDILKQVIGCLHGGKCNEQCTIGFKIIPDELGFYKKMKLPLPRLCSNCRHYQRLKQRNPLKLWYRKCQCAGGKSDNGVYTNTIEHFHKDNHCPNEFETTYAPERKEIVYCEKCYQSEVV